MKRFLIHITLFGFIFSGLTFLLWFSGNKMISSKGSFKFDSDVLHVVLGHSHPQCAVNDSLISGLKNIANSGEAYFYNYIKLKKTLEQNPQLSTVFIEFTNNHIDTLMDTWTWGEVYTSRYSFLFPFTSFEDKKLLMSKNMRGYLNTVPPVLKSNFIHLLQSDFDFTDEIGGYRKLTKNRVDSLLKDTKEKTKLSINDSYPTSETSIRYLQKIIALCNRYKINVVLFRSPQHPKLAIRYNEAHFQRIRNKYFEDIPFLDFNDFPVKKEYFADLEHLNYKGAQMFSIWLNGLLQKGLLKSTDKEAFVRSHMPIQAVEKKRSSLKGTNISQ